MPPPPPPPPAPLSTNSSQNSLNTDTLHPLRARLEGVPDSGDGGSFVLVAEDIILMAWAVPEPQRSWLSSFTAGVWPRLPAVGPSDHLNALLRLDATHSIATRPVRPVFCPMNAGCLTGDHVGSGQNAAK